jgi:hypothetical protein
MSSATLRTAASRVLELADDVGRLRRRDDPELSAAQSVDRIAGHVLSLYWMLVPSAAQLAAEMYPGDDDAVDEALRIVDEHDARLRHCKGGRCRCRECQR